MKISEKEAEKQGEKYCDKMLSNNKLLLILDLDNTLLHAIMAPIDYVCEDDKAESENDINIVEFECN
jgi:hypothetical protein